MKSNNGSYKSVPQEFAGTLLKKISLLFKISDFVMLFSKRMLLFALILVFWCENSQTFFTRTTRVPKSWIDWKNNHGFATLIIV